MNTNAPMSFRKKPIVIQAWQVTMETIEAIAQWSGGRHRGDFKPGEFQFIQLETLEGVMTARLGDWVIRGLRGEFYPCKPAIFDATYEPTPDSTHPEV